MIKIVNVPSLFASLCQVVDYCKDRTSEINIIVPDKLSLFMEKFLFEKLNLTSSFNIKVNTLNRFAKKSCIIDESKQISKIGSILLIYKILNENLDRLSIFRSKTFSFTYAESVYNTIAQLKASRISYEEMLGFSSQDEQLKNKILDLAFIYEQYEKGKAGLLDASDMFLMSSMFVAKDRINQDIIFVGFDDFTSIEYSIIEQLAKCNNVHICNYYGTKSNKSIYNSEVYLQLKKITEIIKVGFDVEDCSLKFRDTKSFLHDNLFGVKDNRFVIKDEVVDCYSGKGIESEIEFVAREIRKNILTGDKFSRHGVAVFDLENNIDKIKEIFEKYEINYYLDMQFNINSSIFYKFLINLFKFNLEGNNLSSLIDIINSPFFIYDREEKNKLIDKLIRINYRGKVEQLSIGDEYKDVVEHLVEFMSYFKFDKKTTAEQVVEIIKSADENFNFEEIINCLASSTSAQTKMLLKKSRVVIYELLDEITKFYLSVDAEKLFDIFTHATGIIKVNNLPLTLDAVKVVDANNFMEVFENLYIINATNEHAPALKFDCGIILDTEIEKLNFAFKLSPTIAHINRLSKLRLFNSALMFENSLMVTYSFTPSELIKELTSKLQVEVENRVVSLSANNIEANKKYLALSDLDYLEYICDNKENNKIYKNLIKNSEKILNYNEKIIKNKNLLQISNNNLEIFNELKNISASTLESYFKCPFSMFLNNVLKIKDRLDTEILSMDIGNILHHIIYVYYKKNKRVDDIYEFCKREVFKFVDTDDRLKLNANSPILSNLIDEAVRVINSLNYIDENSSFVPYLFEHEFKSQTALKLKNIDIIGKVDRVDKFGDMLRIVDYKSGKADATLKELYFGNKLQLFLYSSAMENEFDKKVVGEFYLPLHNKYTSEIENTYAMKGFYLNEDFVVSAFDKRLQPKQKSDIVNVTMKLDGTASTRSNKALKDNDLMLVKNYAKLVSEKAVEEIKSGYIAPSPSIVSEPCKYCSYSHICMRSTCGVDYRVANNVTIESFKEVEHD